MLKFIWNSWWRNKERFILLLVGVLILSTGLSYLIGITQANNGTVVDELQKRWKASYHLVVRPQGSRSVTEDLNLLEPNYLSGMEGGITLEQYERIKAITDVEIAAPIAMMGSIRTSMRLDEIVLEEPGIYRMNISEKTNTGADTETFEGNSYYTVGNWMPAGLGKEYGASPLMSPLDLSFGTEVMIAGIDPEAEAAMVGIDQALIPSQNSRFFSKDDAPLQKEEGIIQIPAIVSSLDYVDANMTYTIERLDIPFEESDQSEAMEEIKEKGAEQFLDQQEGAEIEAFTYTTAHVHKQLIQSILDPASSSTLASSQDFEWMPFKPSPVNYQPVTSPFGNRWPFSYEVQPYSVPQDSLLAVRHMYRPVNMFSETSSNWPKLDLDYIGVFDPQKLDISKDPLTELPMETYFPAKAQWVIDAKNQPVNPPADMKPLNNPYGFLTKPPLILTTIEAAAEVLGEKPISAIRVNVSGVQSLTEESEVKLQEVAKEIEDKTGLITDVTLGSSPQLALTHLPGLEGEDGIGWVQQPWIKLGSSISIFQEAKVGMSGVIASVILVAIVYVFTSSIIMLYARKKEFAVLLAIGWRPSQLSKLLFLESTLLGVAVALISWLILGAFTASGNIEPSLMRILLIGISGLAIYWLGSLVPIWLIGRIEPYESMRSGEVSKRRIRPFRSESIFGMSFNNLFAQWQRSLLSVLAIAVPTSLFIFFLFVTFRLKGVLYATWLGEFVALEVGSMHYVAMAVALLIAVLTTTEIMWQNISERKAQIAVLKAAGWRNNGIRLMVLLEGVATGLLAGLLGLVLAMALIIRLYGQVPFEEFGFLAITLLIPIATGVLGALLPAEKAARILPYGAINGTLQNSKKVEKQFKWAIGIVGTTLVTGVLMLLLFAIPEGAGPSTTASSDTVQKTSGTMLADELPEEKEAIVDPVEEPVAGKASAITELQEKAYRSFILGEVPDKNLELKFSEQVVPPDNLSAKEGYQLLSIPVTLDTSNAEEFLKGATTTYKPYGFKLVDDEGDAYSVVDMEITEMGTWDGKFKYTMPGKTTTILTYELPNNLPRVVLVAHGDYLPANVVVEIPLEKTAASALSPGSSASYNIDLTLDEQDFFDISAEIEVQNESIEAWKELGFYFIPNALTADNKPDILSAPGESLIQNITIGGKEVPYDLEGNRLLVELGEPLEPDGSTTVLIDYRLKLPNNGIRLSKSGNNFHLAQWYPMLAHFDGGWQIEDFDLKGESYHTSYGDYALNYQLPDDFLTVSSAVDGEVLPTSSGTLKGENIKDFYLAFLDPADWTNTVSSADGTFFRTFLPSDGPDFTQQMADSAKDAFSFFEERLGDHPVAELDIIGNNGNMEYPHVIEVNNNEGDFEHTLVHEIAHQWFYHLVPNNPYRDAWLDESIAEWVTAMYLVEIGEAGAFGFSEGMSEANPTTEFVNRPLDEFEKGEYYAIVYGKAPLLLNDFFQENGGQEQAFKFLSAYIANYQHKYVDSEEFAAFFEEQIEGDNQQFLESWLDLEEED